MSVQALDPKTAALLAKVNPESAPAFPKPVRFSRFDSNEGSEVLLSGGLVQREMLTMLSAPAKARKSWLLYALATALATKGTWLGFDALRVCSTLFIDLEVHPHALQMRFRKIAKAAQCNPGDNLAVCAWRHISIEPGMTAERVVQEIVRLAGSGFDVIIIDSVYLLLDGDESDPQAVAALLRPVVGLLKKTGAAVVFSHHYAKGNASAQAGKAAIDRASGSSYWSRFADVLLPLTPPLPDANPDKRELLVLEPEVRHWVRPAPVVLEWEPETSSFFVTDDDPGSMLTPAPKKDREKKPDSIAKKVEAGLSGVDPEKAASCLGRLDRLTVEAMQTVPASMLEDLEAGDAVKLPLSSWVPLVKWEGSSAKVATGKKFAAVVKYLVESGAIDRKEDGSRLYFRSKGASAGT